MMVYAAFLRGIAPSKPNMQNDKLRAAFESIGLNNVRSVLASGNIVFTSDQTKPADLEMQLEQALAKELGLSSKVLVRSQKELQKMVDQNPFGSLTHSQKTYLTVTFFTHKPSDKIEIPYQNTDKTVTVFAVDKSVRAAFSIIDLARVKSSSEFMAWFEKQFGKDITTRTWLSVQKTLAACLKTQK